MKNHDDKQDEDQRKTNEMSCSFPKKGKSGLVFSHFPVPIIPLPHFLPLHSLRSKSYNKLPFISLYLREKGTKSYEKREPHEILDFKALTHRQEISYKRNTCEIYFKYTIEKNVLNTLFKKKRKKIQKISMTILLREGYLWLPENIFF